MKRMLKCVCYKNNNKNKLILVLAGVGIFFLLRQKLGHSVLRVSKLQEILNTNVHAACNLHFQKVWFSTALYRIHFMIVKVL